MARTTDGKRILYIVYTNPGSYPPLEHSSHILANSGWHVMFLGTGGFGSDDLRVQHHPNIDVHRMPFQPSGWRQKAHYLWFCLWALFWTVCWRPDWVYVSDPPACPPGLFFSYLPGVRVIYHEHDSPALMEQKEKPRRLYMDFILWFRVRLARRAAACVLPNEQRARLFTQETRTKRPTLVVLNCPRSEEVASLHPRQLTDNTLKLYYHGTIGPVMLPQTILCALAKLPAHVQLRVIGYETVGSRGYGRELQTLARQLGISDRVRLTTGGMSRSKLLIHCAQHDVGLALMPKVTNNVNHRHLVGASNKPFDYLACGLALLVSNGPEWQETYVHAGYGLACDPEDPESIAAALRWYLEHREEMRTMGRRGRQQICEAWNYECQFQPVLDILNERTQPT